MARLFIDGFESGGLDLWDTVNGGEVSTAQYKGGAYSYYTNNYNQYLIKNLPSAINTIYFKKWIYIITAGAAFAVALFLVVADDAGNQVGLGLNSSRQLAYRLGPNTLNAGSTIVTGSTILALNTWYLIEGKIFIDNTNGIAECKLNGVLPLEIDFDGDTQAQGTTITKVIHGCYGSALGYQIFGYYDDFVLDDAAWIGDSRIQAIVPTGASGAAGHTNWTPSTAPNWDCVEEVPASDTDYLTTNSTGVLDTYTASDITADANTINCIQVQARCAKEGEPTPQHIAMTVRSNGTDEDSASLSLPASPRSVFAIWETDPGNGDAAWTPTTINALEIGVDSSA